MQNKQQAPPQIELGYWRIRLKAHYLRYLLHYVNLQYIEWNPIDAADWRRKKDVLYKLNPMVTIPFFKEGDLVVSKPGAIGMAICMRAGRKDLIGDTPQKIVMIRTLQGSISILTNFFINWTLRQKEDIQQSWKKEFIQIVKPELDKLSQFSQDKTFLMGQVTIADFELCHLLGFMDVILSSCGIKNPLGSYQNLVVIKQNVEQLPGVKEFRQTKKHTDTPWFQPGAVHFDPQFKGAAKKI